MRGTWEYLGLIYETGTECQGLSKARKEYLSFSCEGCIGIFMSFILGFCINIQVVYIWIGIEYSGFYIGLQY